MPEGKRPDSSEWRLGVEFGHPAEPGPERVELRPERDFSAERLNRPMYVVTAERLGWLAVGVYAVASRLVGLGMRPLGRQEAQGALFALRLCRDGLGAFSAHAGMASGWVHALEALSFGAVGAGDFAVRLPGAVLGLALIASAFALRPHLGRAGALAFAAMLTLSPTITWFSRSAAPAVAAAAPMMAAIALFLAVVRKPGATKIAALGCAVGLAMSADLAGLADAALFVVLLAVLGLRDMIFTANAGLRLRVWWERRAAFVMFGVVAAGAFFYLFETDFLRRPFADALFADIRALVNASAKPHFRQGVAFYLPALAFYEFLIVILGAVGALAFAAFRIRSRLGAAAFLWTVLSVAFFLLAPERRADWLAMMVVPAAMLAGAGIDWLHHRAAWRVARYPIGALAIFTLYVQVVAVFVHAAPDPSEAPWARHALLFWSEPVSTEQVPDECRRAREALPEHGTVFFAEDEPVLEWCLRGRPRAADAASASLLVSLAGPGGPERSRESGEFTLEESWKPDLATLTPARALRYLFTARAWNAPSGRDVRLQFHAAALTVAPTPAPSATAMPTAAPSATATASPAVTASSIATASPSVAPSPAAAASPVATGGEIAAPAPTPGVTGVVPSPASPTAVVTPAASAGASGPSPADASQ